MTEYKVKKYLKDDIVAEEQSKQKTVNMVDADLL